VTLHCAELADVPLKGTRMWSTMAAQLSLAELDRLARILRAGAGRRAWKQHGRHEQVHSRVGLPLCDRVLQTQSRIPVEQVLGHCWKRAKPCAGRISSDRLTSHIQCTLACSLAFLDKHRPV
jgi:hypothetical protein